MAAQNYIYRGSILYCTLIDVRYCSGRVGPFLQIGLLMGTRECAKKVPHSAGVAPPTRLARGNTRGINAVEVSKVGRARVLKNGRSQPSFWFSLTAR